MKLDKLFIALTVVGLATMLVSVSARDARLAFDAVGNLFVAGARADMARAAELDLQLRGKESAASYVNRGVGKAARGDFDGAIADFTRTIELDPKEPKAYNNRGLAKHHKGDFEGALAD
jgi:Flp pilus assembly protein TadD